MDELVKKVIEDNIDLIKENRFITLFDKINNHRLSYLFLNEHFHELVECLESAGIYPVDITRIILPYYYCLRTFTTFEIQPHITKIDTGAFSNCSKLTSITIPDSVTSIGDYAFRGCSSLTSVTIPDSVTSIGSSVFYNCKKLKSVIIPSSVKRIEKWAFSDVSKLSQIIYKGSMGDWFSIKLDKCWCNPSHIDKIRCVNGILKYDHAIGKWFSK